MNLLARALGVTALLVLTTLAAAAQRNPLLDLPPLAPGGAPPSPPPAPAPATPAPPAPAPAPQPELWGALAFTADGSWSTAWKKPSKAEAESTVAVSCAKFGRGSCQIVSFPNPYCAALATYIGSHSRRSYKLSFSGGGVSVPEAQRSAMDRCNADQRTRNRCQLRTVVCADGR